MPFERGWEHGPMRRPRLIDALKGSAGKGSAVDDRSTKAQTRHSGAVHDAAPNSVASPVELVGMFEAQQSFGFAVAGLLAQIGLGSLAAMVPHEGRGRESDPHA